jgi:uncharacterized protein
VKIPAFSCARYGAFVESALKSTAGTPVGSRNGSAWKGPWPLVAGALGLAGVNIATLGLSGRPWGITSALALWGSKVLATLSVNVVARPYWQVASNAAALRAGVLSDITSVMDLGILLGASLAAGMAGRFAPVWRVPAKSVLAGPLVD